MSGIRSSPGGTIPPLENDKAAPLEFIHSEGHLPGKHLPIATFTDCYLEAKMPIYCAHILGLHDRSIGVVQLDCIDDESAIKSASRLVDSHALELWQMDRPVARFDAQSKQTRKK